MFSFTLPWVVLFSDSELYQSPASLRTRRRTFAIPRRVLFCSSTSLIVSVIRASQPVNLSLYHGWCYFQTRESINGLGVWEHVGGLVPFLGRRFFTAQTHWLFSVSGLANQVTCRLERLVHQQLLESLWFWISTDVLAQFSMTDICQFFSSFLS